MTKKVKEHIGFRYLLTEVNHDSFGIEYIPQEVLKQNQR